MNGYKIVCEVLALEMGVQSAAYLKRMIAKFRAQGNMAMVQKFERMLTQAGRHIA